MIVNVNINQTYGPHDGPHMSPSFPGQELSTLDPQVFHLTLDEAGALVPEQRLVLRLGTSCLLEEGLQLEELQNCPVDTSPGDARRVFALFLRCFFFFINEGLWLYLVVLFLVA